MPAVVNIRCSSGNKFTIETEFSITVKQFKELLVEKSTVPTDQQRLIYKGKVLKDDATLESYGLEENHTIHLVRGSSAAAARPTGSPSPSSSTSGDSNGVNDSSNVPFYNSSGFLGTPNQATGMPFLPQMGGQEMANMQQQLMQDPDLMRQILDSPMVQSIMSDPNLIRNIIMNNPAMRQILESNPQLNHVLNDPEMLRQTMEAVRNPATMREMMRNQDTALRNIESHPEGFNALRRMYQDVQEPLMNATAEAAAIHHNFSNGTTQTPTPSTTTPSATPNTSPLPNPWAPQSNTNSNNTRSVPSNSSPVNPWATTNLFGATNPFGGTSGATGQMPDIASLMRNNPLMQAQMSQMLSNPAILQQMEQSNPALQNMLSSNPQMRQMLSNPQFLQAMSDPNNLQAIMQMEQAMRQLSQSGLFPSPNGAGGFGALPTTGTSPSLSTPNAFDFTQFMNAMGSVPQQQQQQANQTNSNPETLYSSQLAQMNEMGFTNREQNLRALQQAMGNVNLAVERILGGSA